MTNKLKSVSFSLLKREFNVSELSTNIRSVGPVVWSWGMHDLANMNDKGLMFRVNGHHHKGWVLITLDWDDTLFPTTWMIKNSIDLNTNAHTYKDLDMILYATLSYISQCY